MKRSKKMGCGVLPGLFVAGVSLMGCHHTMSSVVVIPRTTSTLLWEPMHMGVVESARGRGIHLYWNAPTDEGDIEKQVNLVAASLRKECRGIIFAPDETLAARSIVLQAVNAHVPVVVVDDELGPPAGPYLSYVSTDEKAGSRMAAGRIAQLLRGHGSIAVMGISPRLESGLTREEDFEEALRDVAPAITIAVRRFGDTVVTHQQQIAQEILNGREPPDAIVALTSTATRGAYYARIATQPRPAVKIVGFDQDLLVPVQLGEVDAVVVQDTLAIGKIAMQNLDAQMRGEQVASRTSVAPILLTQETMRAVADRGLWSFAGYTWSGQ